MQSGAVTSRTNLWTPLVQLVTSLPAGTLPCADRTYACLHRRVLPMAWMLAVVATISSRSCWCSTRPSLGGHSAPPLLARVLWGARVMFAAMFGRSSPLLRRSLTFAHSSNDLLHASSRLRRCVRPAYAPGARQLPGKGATAAHEMYAGTHAWAHGSASLEVAEDTLVTGLPRIGAKACGAGSASRRRKGICATCGAGSVRQNGAGWAVVTLETCHDEGIAPTRVGMVASHSSCNAIPWRDDPFEWVLASRTLGILYLQTRCPGAHLSLTTSVAFADAAWVGAREGDRKG